MDIGTWLSSVGLQQYQQVFEANDVGVDVLPYLTDADMAELGLTEIDKAALKSAAAVLSSSNDPDKQSLQFHPERRYLTVLYADLVGSTPLCHASPAHAA